MAAKKDKMIPSEKERKRALKYATPAGTGRMWVTMGIAFIIFGIILLLIPIGLVISEASAQRYDPESIHTATLVFYLLGAFFGFCGCFCVIFGKLAVKAFAKILCKGEINYPVAEYKTPKKQLLQEAAAINQSPNAPLTASTFGNWIDFEADWQNCLSIHNGILQSHQIFKKLILVQDNFTYKELDYENNSELGVGVKTFAAGSTTTIDQYEQPQHPKAQKDAAHINKHAMHIVRLYYTAFDILEKGEIITHRDKEREELLAIRNGKYMREDGSYAPEFFEFVDALEKRFQDDVRKTPLPAKPDFGKIEELLVEINKSYLRRIV